MFFSILFFNRNRHEALKVDVVKIIHCELGNKKKTVKAKQKDTVPEFEWETKNDMIVHCNM